MATYKTVYVVQTVPEAYEYDANIGWNAGAWSTDFVGTTQSYKFQLFSSPVGIVTGLASNPAGVGYANMEYAFFIAKDEVRVIESNDFKTGYIPFTYSVNDNPIFQIVRHGTRVLYYVDGDLVYTSETDATEDTYFIDASLYSGGDGIADAVIYDVYPISATISGSSSLSVTPTVTRNLSATIGGQSILYSVMAIDGDISIGVNISTGSVLEADMNVITGFGTQTIACSSSISVTMNTRLARSENELPSLTSLGSDYAYANGSASFEPMTSYAEAGAPLLSYGIGYGGFAGLFGSASGLTGGIGGSDIELEALDSLGADKIYGEAENEFQHLEIIGGTYIEYDGYLLQPSPIVTCTASGYETDPNLLYGDIPEVTLEAYSGARLDVTITGYASVSASGTVPNIGRLNKPAPAVTATASGTTGSYGSAILSYKIRASLVAYGGAYAFLSVPKVSVTASGTVGSIGRLVAASPKVSLYTESSAGGYGSLVAAVPEVTPLYGISYGDVPVVYITAYSQVSTGSDVTYAVNADNAATTRYTNYHFDHMFRFNGDYYGISNSVVYRLDGDTDDGTDIPAAFELAPFDDGSTEFKRLPYIRTSGRADQSIRVTAIADEEPSCPVVSPALDRTGTHVRRCKLAKGKRAHYWGVKIQNQSGDELDVDFVEYTIETLSRTQ